MNFQGNLLIVIVLKIPQKNESGLHFQSYKLLVHLVKVYLVKVTLKVYHAEKQTKKVNNCGTRMFPYKLTY